MKKLGKLTVNEMGDYVPLNSEEQMAMKGGTVMTAYHWVSAVYTAWKVSKEIMELVNGSGGSTTPSCPPGSSSVHQADSVVFNNGIVAHGSTLVCIPCK